MARIIDVKNVLLKVLPKRVTVLSFGFTNNPAIKDIPPRIIQKALEYQKFLLELSEKIGDADATREFILENSGLVFYDPDFMIYALAQAKISRKRGDEANAKFWEQVISLITNTIAIYG